MAKGCDVLSLVRLNLVVCLKVPEHFDEFNPSELRVMLVPLGRVIAKNGFHHLHGGSHTLTIIGIKHKDHFHCLGSGKGGKVCLAQSERGKFSFSFTRLWCNWRNLDLSSFNRFPVEERGNVGSVRTCCLLLRSKPGKTGSTFRTRNAIGELVVFCVCARNVVVSAARFAPPMAFMRFCHIRVINITIAISTTNTVGKIGSGPSTGSENESIVTFEATRHIKKTLYVARESFPHCLYIIAHPDAPVKQKITAKLRFRAL
jgi:hypothetical protein